jgi:hypothetical protein
LCDAANVRAIDLFGSPYPNYQVLGYDLVFMNDGIAAVAANVGLRVVDTSNAADFVEIALAGPPLLRVAPIAGRPDAADLTAALTSNREFAVWNLADPAAPALLGNLPGPYRNLVRMQGGARSVAAVMLQPTDAWPGEALQLIDCADPTQPRPAGSLRLPGLAEGGWIEQSVLYLACRDAGLVVADVADLDAPRIIGGLTIGRIHDVRQVAGRLLVAGSNFVALPADVATPVEFALAEFAATVVAGGVDVSWSLFSARGEPEFRLMRVTAGGELVVPYVADGPGRWSARDLPPGTGTIVYRLEYRPSPQRPWEVAGERQVDLLAPATAYFLPPAPNPFNPTVSLRFEVPRSGHVELRIFDLGGRCVRRLVSGFYPAGQHGAIWDGCSDDGAIQPSGAYLARLEAGDAVGSQKLLLAR